MDEFSYRSQRANHLHTSPSAYTDTYRGMLTVIWNGDSKKDPLFALHRIFSVQGSGCIEGTDRKWSQLLLTISFLLSLFLSYGDQTEIWESGRNGLEGVASFKLWRNVRKIWEFFVTALSPLRMAIIGTRNNALYCMCKTLGV